MCAPPEPAPSCRLAQLHSYKDMSWLLWSRDAAIVLCRKLDDKHFVFAAIIIHLHHMPAQLLLFKGLRRVCVKFLSV